MTTQDTSAEYVDNVWRLFGFDGSGTHCSGPIDSNVDGLQASGHDFSDPNRLLFLVPICLGMAMFVSFFF